MPASSFAIRLALFYAALFLIYGIHLPYFPVWLESRGLTVEQISWIIAAPLFIRLAVTPIIAARADKARSHTRYIQVLAAVAVIAALILSQLTQFWYVAAGSVLLAIAFTGIMPLTEAIALTGVRSSKIDYGRMRLWGSASFILAGLIGGAAIEEYGPGVGIWLLATATAITAFAAWVLPTITTTKQPTNAPKQDPVQIASRLEPTQLNAAELEPTTLNLPNPALRSKIFLLFLICAGLSQASHATYYTFATLSWLKQGISPFWIGGLWSIGVIAEIALFSYSRAIVEKTGAVTLMIVGAAAGVIRWTAMAFEPSLSALIPLQLLHALTYGATHLGAIHFIANAIPHHQTATAQAFYGAIGNGFAMGAAILLSGWLYASWQGDTYLAMAAVSLVATVAGLMLLKTWHPAPASPDHDHH